MIRDAVRHYIDRGLKPVPIYGIDDAGNCRCGQISARLHGKDGKGRGKHEIFPDWKDRLFEVSDFTEQDNVALAMGPQRDGRWLVALDIDGRSERPPEYWNLPGTWMQVSGDGIHLIYEVEPYTPLGNWRDALCTKMEKGWAIDMRYARGAVVSAPSRHYSGRYYEEIGGEVSRLPAWFIERVTHSRRMRNLPVQMRWHREGRSP